MGLGFYMYNIKLLLTFDDTFKMRTHPSQECFQHRIRYDMQENNFFVNGERERERERERSHHLSSL